MMLKRDMTTKVVHITGDKESDARIYEEAAKILKGGGLVAFPTETVYGLGADAFDEEACKKIYGAKGRPSDNPLIVHIADPHIPENLVSEVPEKAKKLMDSFWPGPLTIILKKRPGVPDAVTGGLDTVAVRCPGHPVAAELLRTSGLCIAAPSANISGRPSPTRGEHVVRDLAGRVDMIIIDDTVDVGLESTITDLSTDVPVILRPGVITPDQIEKCIGRTELDSALVRMTRTGSGDKKEEQDISWTDTAPKAPGMKYRHYAPEGELFVVRGEPGPVLAFVEDAAEEARRKGKKCAVLCRPEHEDIYRADVVFSYGKDAVSAAAGLFDTLRKCDGEGCDVIFAEGLEEEGVGLAVMNRLIKAAGHNIIDV